MFYNIDYLWALLKNLKQCRRLPWCSKFLSLSLLVTCSLVSSIQVYHLLASLGAYPQNGTKIKILHLAGLLGYLTNIALGINWSV